MEAANLKRQQPGDWWRAVDPSKAYLEIEQKVDPDTGSLDPFNMVWPGFGMTPRPGDSKETLIVPASTDTWRVRVANTRLDLTANPAHDWSNLPFWLATDMHRWPWAHSLFYRDGESHSYPWMRIDFTTARAWWQIGRLYVTKAWKPSHDVRVGWSLKYEHNVTYEETQSGAEYPMPGPGKKRSLKFTLQHLSEDEMFDNAFEIDRDRGGDGDLLAIRDWESRHVHRYMVYGSIRDIGEISSLRGLIFDKNYTIKEFAL